MKLCARAFKSYINKNLVFGTFQKQVKDTAKILHDSNFKALNR